MYDRVQSDLARPDLIKPVDYDLLRVAVQDLLIELRISPEQLEIMAGGCSPEYVQFSRGINKPTCKVQISQMVARKLIDANVTNIMVKTE